MASLQEQAKAQLVKQGLLPSKDAKPAYQRSNATRIVNILKLAQQGLSQATIASEVGCSQQCVSQTLAKYGRNTSKEARQILEAKAADMALNVAKHGRPADQLRALEGLNVIDLREKQQPGLSITINGFALVGLGLNQGETPQPILDAQPLSPPLSADMHSLSADNTGAKGNIKPLISPPDSGQYEGQSGAGIAGGPYREGKG